MKLRNTIILGLGMLLSINLARGQESQTTFTLEECINYAWENNLNVRQLSHEDISNHVVVFRTGDIARCSAVPQPANVDARVKT